MDFNKPVRSFCVLILGNRYNTVLFTSRLSAENIEKWSFFLICLYPSIKSYGSISLSFSYNILQCLFNELPSDL
jgi:hypothetical protein